MRNASLDEWNFIPLEEDQCINELHAKKNKDDNSGESGAQQILIYTVNFHSFIYSVRGNFFGLARRGSAIGFHLLWHTVELAMSTRLCLL